MPPFLPIDLIDGQVYIEGELFDGPSIEAEAKLAVGGDVIHKIQGLLAHVGGTAFLLRKYSGTPAEFIAEHAWAERIPKYFRELKEVLAYVKRSRH